MKNKLIPISKSGSEYQPSLVDQGYKYGKIVNNDGALRLSFGKNDYHEFRFRPDLLGLVRGGGYLPVVHGEGGDLFFVQDPTEYVIAAFELSKKD